ncbi:MAG: hypothetical protein JSV16_07600, partial [Candidatus Hydrogenedentota bacterium]
AELISGITRTISATALPVILNSGDREAFFEMVMASRMLAFVESRWDKEFRRLAQENVTMRNVLREAAEALRQLDHPEAAELTKNLGNVDFDVASLPPISALHEQNVLMKKRLEKFILIHAGMPEGGTSGLQTVRRRIREFLKEINRRDFEAAQLVLNF